MVLARKSLLIGLGILQEQIMKVEDEWEGSQNGRGIENVRAIKRAASLPLSLSPSASYFVFLQRGTLIAVRLSLRVSGMLLWIYF